LKFRLTQNVNLRTVQPSVALVFFDIMRTCGYELNANAKLNVGKTCSSWQDDVGAFFDACLHLSSE